MRTHQVGFFGQAVGFQAGLQDRVQDRVVAAGLESAGVGHCSQHVIVLALAARQANANPILLFRLGAQPAHLVVQLDGDPFFGFRKRQTVDVYLAEQAQIDETVAAAR